MAVSPLIRICRAKHQEMLCFAEFGDLTGVAFSLHRSRPEIIKKTAISVICETRSKKKNSIYVSLYRPNTGQQKKQDTFEDTKEKHKMVR